MYFFAWGAYILLLTGTLFAVVDRRMSRRTIVFFVLTFVAVLAGILVGGPTLYTEGLQLLLPMEFLPRLIPVYIVDIALIAVDVSILFAFLDKKFSARSRISYYSGISLFALVLYLLVFVQF